MAGHRKLSPEIIAEIREKYASGTYSCSTLGAYYGVHAATIRGYVKGIKRDLSQSFSVSDIQQQKRYWRLQETQNGR